MWRPSFVFIDLDADICVRHRVAFVSTPFDTATSVDAIDGRFCCFLSYLGVRATVSLIDLSRSVAIVCGRLNVARFVSFGLMRRCLYLLTSNMMKLEHFQWSMVLAAMLVFESIVSLMFGSALPMR
jgi:hypothetical protein